MVELRQVLEAIETLSPTERHVVRAVIDALEKVEPAEPGASYADSDEVRRVAREFMARFPEAMRTLAGL